jgi:anti-anti-sigma factor
MDITRQKHNDRLVLQLTGRLDANWCDHVQAALDAAVRDGEHHLQLDLAGVSYISSAGLRVLLAAFKQLQAINGRCVVIRGSAAVRSILELAGLDQLLVAEETAPAAAETGASRATAGARYELYRLSASAPGIRLATIATDDPDRAPAIRFGPHAFALGIGALGGTAADCAPRFGEFLAVSGTAAFQPSDGSSRPDFLLSQGALVPAGRLFSGLSGTGDFTLLARFAATDEARTVGLVELASAALEFSAAPAAAFVAVTETAGLVGAALRRSPAADPAADRFAFPAIRDWLTFTGERAFRDSASLLVGVVARPGTPLDPQLRPLGGTGLLAHVHAAAFPYRPLRKGRIDLPATLGELFDGPGLTAVLHLLADPRGVTGAGESAFARGALWLAPVETKLP